MGLLLLTAGANPSVAGSQQDYCIKCTAPDETYICRIVSSSSQTRGKQFLCIMNIAKEHGHDSCTASAEAQNCSGVLVQYEVAGSDSPPVSADQTAAARPAPDLVPEPQSGKKSEPKTLVEFTKQTSTATKNGIKSAGNDTKKAIKNTGIAIEKTGGKIKKFTGKVGGNIKKAGKTTMECITSLFFNCF